ncbi:unnamed protein product [Rhizopus stolonifer]
MSKRIFSQVINDASDRSAIPIQKSTPDLAKKCAQTAIAPPPKHIKKVELPFHFQFDQSTTDEKDQASACWSQGLDTPFRSYRQYMQENKTKDTNNMMKNDKTLLYSATEGVHVNMIAKLSQHSIIEQLKHHISWLNTKDIDQQCLCLFTLLVYLDPVLTPKNISILRDVSRKCIELRSTVDNKAPLNIIISIISQIFGQGDLK